jgi:hypothetical protein
MNNYCEDFAEMDMAGVDVYDDDGAADRDMGSRIGPTLSLISRGM